jgi:CRP-like cAMP-binding protein
MSKEILIQFIEANLPSPRREITTTIVSHFEEKLLQKGEFLLQEGQLSDEYLFLESGFIRSYTTDPEGNDITTNFYGARQVVFEVSSFFTRSKSKETIQALTDCRGYVISFSTLNNLFHTISEFREFGRSMLVKGYVALKQRTLALINETAEERYASLVNTEPAIFQHAPLKHIATYLGITDTSLSRIRREFQKK